MNRPRLVEALLLHADAALAGVEVAIDCEVVSYDAASQTASIRPCVRAVEVDPETGELVAPEADVIAGVPVMWPSGGGRSLTWGLDVGDLGLAVIRSRSHDEVDSAASVPALPASTRRFNWSDAVFLPRDAVPERPLSSDAYRNDGQAVFALPTGEALHLGTGTAALRLVIEDVLRPHLVAVKAWLDALTLPVSGATAGPPSVPSPSVPVTADLASGRVKVDT